jgi:hypothetical protein
MTINEDAMEKMRAFINNPSDETLEQIISQHYYCCLSYLVEDFADCPSCPKECPACDTTIYKRYCLCDFSRLQQLWEVDKAKTVLYIMRLLACAESYVGINS